jgi:hypothetical protein
MSGNVCAFPGCQVAIVEHSGTVTGEICHIKAKNSKGSRYDKKQAENKRNAFENLILLCRTHHKIVDDNPRIYDVSALIEIKSIHENLMKRTEVDQDSFFARILLNDKMYPLNNLLDEIEVHLKKFADWLNGGLQSKHEISDNLLSLRNLYESHFHHSTKQLNLPFYDFSTKPAFCELIRLLQNIIDTLELDLSYVSSANEISNDITTNIDSGLRCIEKLRKQILPKELL